MYIQTNTRHVIYHSIYFYTYLSSKIPLSPIHFSSQSVQSSLLHERTRSYPHRARDGVPGMQGDGHPNSSTHLV